MPDNSQKRGGDLRIKSPQLYPSPTPVNPAPTAPALHNRTAVRSEMRSAAPVVRGSVGPTPLRGLERCPYCGRDGAIDPGDGLGCCLTASREGYWSDSDGRWHRFDDTDADETPEAEASAAPARGIALADHGDLCAGCRRLINVNEPIYGDGLGHIRCGACNDAVPEPRDRAAPAYAPEPHPGDLVLSLLLRRAARALSVASARYLDNQEMNGVRIIAAELQLRACLLQSIADGEVPTERPMSWAQVLTLIGEVRS